MKKCETFSKIFGNFEKSEILKISKIFEKNRKFEIFEKSEKIKIFNEKSKIRKIRKNLKKSGKKINFQMENFQIKNQNWVHRNFLTLGNH